MKYSTTDFNGKTILITGGAGFIGSNLAFYFQENYPDAKIVVFDLFRSGETFENGNLKSFGHFKNLLGFRGEILCGDLNDPTVWERFRQYRFDYIFHQAAISDTTVYDQNIMLKTNLNTFKDLIDLAQEHDAALVYASSGATYGDANAPQTVGREAPQNVYGFSKLMMDHLVYDTLKSRPDAKIVGLRYFNVYGPREFYKNKTASMILQLGHQILSGKAPKLFYGSDAIRRDFIYIDDVIQANVKAAEPLKSGVYNVGTGIARSFQEIADILQTELQTDYGTDYIDNPYIGSYQFLTCADIAPTIDGLGYQPHVTLEEGVKRYLPEIRRIYEIEVRK
ncbi:MAG: ADP-glyceromanno-heptose 6-epimerase [Sulfuricurvum sp.]